MRIAELRIGMLVFLGHRRAFDFAGKARVEAIGYDWAIVREDNNRVWLLEADDDVELYVEEKGDDG